MSPEIVGLIVVLVLYFALTFWMVLDAVRRGRGWVRWQVLALLLNLLVAIPVWLFRRRKWPRTVEISGARKLRLGLMAAGIAAVNLALGPFVATFVTTNLYQVARVEGQAMSPTLNNEDRLVVNKRVYRTGDPMIGDIVMLSYPLDPEKSFVKRVIASGGDEVRIDDGVVFRNGRRVDEPYVTESSRSHEQWGPEVVPEGNYFVMGDHRNNSSDSRDWGYVPREYMLGRITLRWWPIPARRRF